MVPSPPPPPVDTFAPPPAAAVVTPPLVPGAEVPAAVVAVAAVVPLLEPELDPHAASTAAAVPAAPSWRKRRRSSAEVILSRSGSGSGACSVIVPPIEWVLRPLPEVGRRPSADCCSHAAHSSVGRTEPTRDVHQASVRRRPRPCIDLGRRSSGRRPPRPLAEHVPCLVEGRRVRIGSEVDDTPPATWGDGL